MNRQNVIAPDAEREQTAFEPLRTVLAQMAAMTRDNDDAEQSGKFLELADKLEKGDLTVAFCGHFSAGKSTLVNALCGAPLLPSSPIPTSANVVTVRNGEPSARMSFRDNGGHVSQMRTIPVEELHGFAVDGEGVASIEVSYPIPRLGDAMAIVDTPGVDSTDSAHRAATESALHLADVVFYVSDYNHVLSDVNFRFLRNLADWGKPTYVIVNQIDKHREEEVAFTAFHDGLVRAMEEWRIHPAGILFLSLREPDHPLSQWEGLLAVLDKLQPLRSDLMIRSAVRSSRYLADRFLDTLRAANREEREQLLQRLGEADRADGISVHLREERARLNEQLEAVRTAGERRLAEQRAELDRLLANANVTPAETRDKAAAVLESLQVGFKVGWLSGAAKTEAERERRVTQLTEDFNRQISAHLSGHVKEMLRRSAEEAGWNDTEMETSLDAAFQPVTEEWIRARVKPGMGADGQATLQYAAEVSSDVKGLYRKTAVAWLRQLEDRRKPEREEDEAQLAATLADLGEKEEAAARLAALEEADVSRRDQLLSQLPRKADEDTKLPLPVPPAPNRALVLSEREEQPVPESTGAISESAGADEEYPLGASGGAAELLERAANLLTDTPALRRTAEGLSAKAERFRSSRFTIALFGAFSAGKSSFANALVGLPALPVSPNPTTATINRILAPTEENAHGTAWITMKSQEAMIGDIRHSLQRLGVSKPDIEAAGDEPAVLLELAGRMPADRVHPKGKPHLAFLSAAAQGWASYADLLGTQFAAGSEDYRRYAADEMASCFVAEIDLFVDSPLTRGGAVLVDTPGADSINARHTGVAFEYIKNADAVLFVTYYNHAFTEADRQFLNQLGSVKDVFELDKMFFVINAADLAASESELQAVKEHVAAQLVKHGIRNPRLFAVSSLHGLKAKRAGQREAVALSGLAAFEAAFRKFAETELGGLAMASAHKEVERAGKQLEAWLSSASADAATREAEAAKLLRQAETWREQGTEQVPPAAVQPLWQEAAEQMYHLRQRVYYRFNEHFQTAFHPSVLQEDGRDLKYWLTVCWDDLKRSVGDDLLQELRAAGLRMEAALQRTVEAKLATASADLAGQGFAEASSARPELHLPLNEPFAEGPQLDGRKLWQAFKSPKHFFEKDGSAVLRDELSELLFRTTDESLSALRERWVAAISSTLQTALAEAYLELSRELAAYAQNLAESMQRPEERIRLADIRERWHTLSADSGASNQLS